MTRPRPERPATLSDLVFWVEAVHGGRSDLVSFKDGGQLVEVSTAEWLESIRRLALWLEAQGVEPGDRVAIFSENCPEWHTVDFASQLLGAVTVPIYPTLPADQVAFILDDCGARIVFYSDAAKRKILDEAIDGGDTARVALRAGDGIDEIFSEILAAVDSETPLAAFRGRTAATDIASIIYTSGTTGEPKGVVLTHANLVSNMTTCAELVPIGPTDTSLSFLPLSHVLQRTVDNIFFYRGVRIHYLSSIEHVARALTEIRPTVLASVPRLYERAYLRVMGNVEKEKAASRRIFEWAIDLGMRAAEARRAGRWAPHLKAQRRLAERLVYRKIHERMGGRLRLAITGGAALPESVGRFFEAVGLELYEGYGLTETSPVLCLNRPGEHRWGSVGRPIPGVEIRIADDGEILAKTPGLMQGYWQRKDETCAAIDPDGWFHTGDVGVVDADGYLRITDRKKDLLVTSGGKNIAPQPLEQALTATGIISQAVVVGDNYPYLAALLVANHDDLPPELARLEPAELLAHPRLLERVERTVAAVNRQVAEHERIRRWRLLPGELTLDAGEITPTLKVRRRVVLDRYGDLIASMYLKSQRVGQ